MKHFIEATQPARTVKRLDRVTCDLCGDAIAYSAYEVDEVTISHRMGEAYPESGSGTKVEVGMCGKCFTTKLRPWLAAQGAEPLRETEWDV